MTKKRREHSDEFKARVGIGSPALRGVKTLSELSAAYGVHPTVIAQWKRQLLDWVPAQRKYANSIDSYRQ